MNQTCPTILFIIVCKAGRLHNCFIALILGQRVVPRLPFEADKGSSKLRNSSSDLSYGLKKYEIPFPSDNVARDAAKLPKKVQVARKLPFRGWKQTSVTLDWIWFWWQGEWQGRGCHAYAFYKVSCILAEGLGIEESVLSAIPQKPVTATTLSTSSLECKRRTKLSPFNTWERAFQHTNVAQ